MIKIDDALLVIKQNPGFYFAKDLQSTYYSASESFLLIAGIQKNKDIQGKTDADLPLENNIEEVRFHDSHVVTQQTSWTGYECGRTAFSPQADVYCFNTKTPLINDSNEIIGLFGVMFPLSAKIDVPLVGKLNKQLNDPEQNYHFVTPPALQHLTPQELICWFFILRGKTSKQIAQAMKISPKTVDFHLINIKNKLNIKYKKDIIDYAFANNLLQFIPPAIRNEHYVQFLKEE